MAVWMHPYSDTATVVCLLVITASYHFQADTSLLKQFINYVSKSSDTISIIWLRKLDCEPVNRFIAE